MKKIQIKAKVLENKKVASSYYHMILDAKTVSAKSKPGQFVHIQVDESLDPYFRRPFSILRAKKNIEILFDVVGPGTKILSKKVKGEELDLLGPLGNHFCLPPKGTKQVVMIAGGVGVAPFLILSDLLKSEGYNLLLLYGARSKAQTFNMKEYKDNGCKVFVSTDDGSKGIKGRVSELYKKIDIKENNTFIYACGPRPMLSSVIEFGRENDFKGQVSAEEVMACGIGVCLGCATKTKLGYKTVCNDGPVFNLDDFEI